MSILKQKAKKKQAGKKLVDLITENPFQNPPPHEKLLGDTSGLYSRRIIYSALVGVFGIFRGKPL